jgi:NTE family protein
MLCHALEAQEAQQRRPKIGLVLSGGGAKGLAHIGVLKVLERAGITPDYITGTSMGSVVGGLYAMGYSADELEKIVNEIDWDDVLTNKVPLNEIAIEEKPFYNRYAIELPVPKFFKIAFPNGIIEGEKLQELLLRVTRPVHDVDDFSKLPIPFACVATDIATGKAVVLNKGSLAQCMRASMAIPTVFTPVEIDGKLLVDGGLVRNFPVQEVKDMGADIVIGVFVSDDLKSKDELDGFIDILFQTSWVLSAYDTRKQRELVDYYVQPDHAGYGTGDFKMSRIIMDDGEKEAERHAAKFKRLADSVYAMGPRPQPKLPVGADEYPLRRIIVEGNWKIPTHLIRGKLGLKERRTVSSQKVEKQVALLFGTQHFSTVGYQLHRADSGNYDLAINVKEAPQGKIKAAFHYDTENKAGININLTLRNFLLSNSRALAEVDLAEFPRATLNYLKYVGKDQNVAAMLNVDFNKFEPPLTNANGTTDLYSVNQYSATATLFSTSFTNHTFGAAVSRNFIQLTPKISQSLASAIGYIQNNGTTLQAFFQTNTLERPFYPLKGVKAFVSASAFLNTQVTLRFDTDTLSFTQQEYSPNIGRLDMGYLKIFPVRRFLSIITEAKTTFSSSSGQNGLTILGTTYFGGFRPRVKDAYAFYGASTYDFSVTSYGFLRTDLQFKLSDRMFLTAGVNYVDILHPMSWLDNNYTAAGDLVDGQTWRLGYGLSAGYLSVIGPISLTLAMDSRKQDVLANFSLGFYY